MPGPCSNPQGDKAEWERLNEKVCNIHKHCWPHLPYIGYDKTTKTYYDVEHEFITNRLWLVQRNKLRTGKTFR